MAFFAFCFLGAHTHSDLLSLTLSHSSVERHSSLRVLGLLLLSHNLSLLSVSPHRPQRRACAMSPHTTLHTRSMIRAKRSGLWRLGWAGVGRRERGQRSRAESRCVVQLYSVVTSHRTPRQRTLRSGIDYISASSIESSISYSHSICTL